MTGPEALRAYAALLHHQPGPGWSEDQEQELIARGVVASLEEIAAEQGGPPEAFELLYEAAGVYPNGVIRAQAFRALARMGQEGQAQAVDWLYRLAVEYDSLPARQAILSRGWEASCPALKALFDWHAALSSGIPFPPERLGEITEAYFHLASPELQKRMLAAAGATRMKNWARMVAALQGGAEHDLARLVEDLPSCNSHERHVALDQLERLAGEGSKPAQDALCRLFAEQDDPRAKEIALAQGYTPEEMQQRALFFFLAENWPAYTRLDFNHSLLAGAYESASRPLRRRLMDHSRRTGQTEWLHGLGPAGEVRWPNDLADADWELALHRLAEAGKQDDLWRLAQSAPPVWSAHILERLAQAGWQPGSEAEREGFSHLVALARQCLAHPLTLHPSKSLHSPAPDITCLAIHPGGKLLAAGSSDQRISAWDLPEGSLRPAQILSPAPLTRALALDPAGELLACASGDHRIRVFELKTGKLLKALEGHRAMVRALAIHPNGRILFSAGFDGEIGFWRFPTGPEVTAIRPGAGEIFSLALTAGGQTLVSGGIDGQARLWTVPEGVQSGQIDAHAGTLTHLAAGASGELVASAGRDGKIALWNTRSGALVRDMNNEVGPLTGLCLLANDLVLASGHQGGEIALWNLSSGKEIDRLAGHAGPITGMALNPEGNTLYTGDTRGNLLVWDLRTFLTTRLAERAGQPGGAEALQKRLGSSQAPEHPRLSAAEKTWLAFSLELARWRQRFDIELSDQAPVEVGEFDIEIG